MLIFKELFGILIIAAFIFNGSAALATSKKEIIDYHQTFIPIYDKNGNLRIAIRSYYLGEVPYYLIVNPYTFSTDNVPIANFKSRRILANDPGYFSMQELQATPYMKALFKYTSPPYKLENYGITEAAHHVNGVFLTIDMCPSIYTFETEFFKALVAKTNAKHYPTPVAISITGLWIVSHPKEFQWLIEQVNANKLVITWVNHSFSHIYFSDLSSKENFLLTPQTNMTQEILFTEKILLRNGQKPSVFFRFPGLYSNEKLILKLRKYGLIPIGSNAWLAKNQPEKAGSIILVHGNSNEPEGISKFMSILKKPDLHLLPLNEAFKV